MTTNLESRTLPPEIIDLVCKVFDGIELETRVRSNPYDYLHEFLFRLANGRQRIDDHTTLVKTLLCSVSYEVENMIRGCESAITQRRLLKEAVTKIWPPDCLSANVQISPHCGVVCTKCRHARPVYDLANKERLKETHFFCECDPDHTLVVQSSNGDLIALLGAHIKLL